MKYLLPLLYMVLKVTIQTKLTKSNVLIAIDCGSSGSYIAPEGFTYMADDYYFGSSRTGDYTYSETLQNNKIKYTMDAVVYATERHGESFGYDIPLAEPGTYTLILKFVELYFSLPEERVFNILLGDRVILENFSILDKVPGKIHAHDEYVEFKLEDDQIFYNGIVCENAYKYKSGRVVLEFQMGIRDLPKIDAIVLVRGGINSNKKLSYLQLDTDYEERQKMISNWEDLEKDQEELINQFEKQPKQKIEPIEIEEEQGEGLFSLLFSFYGILIQLTIGAFFLCLFLLDRKQPSKDSKSKTKRKVFINNLKKYSKVSKGVNEVSNL